MAPVSDCRQWHILTALDTHVLYLITLFSSGVHAVSTPFVMLVFEIPSNTLSCGGREG